MHHALVMTTDEHSLLTDEEAVRARFFIGRKAELAALQRALDEAGPWVLYVHGPSGIGKSSLLHRYAAEAAERGVPTIRLDIRDIDPSPHGLAAALDTQGFAAERSCRGERRLVLLDTYELLDALAATSVRELLRRVDRGTLLVVAGRTPPSSEWRGLSLWGRSVAAVPLRNLAAEDAADYLRRRGVDPAVIAEITAFSHGHPLALAIAADAWTAAPYPFFAPEHTLDVITTLYDFFMRGQTEPGGRALVEAAAVLPTVTEPALAALLGALPRDPFVWLRSLSFMAPGPRGLVPHDLVRNVILAELRWRNPERLATLATRAQRHYARIVEVSGEALFTRAFADFAFVLSHNPRARVLMVPSDVDSVLDELRPGDAALVCAAVERHEGPAAAHCTRHWLTCQPAGFRVARRASGEPAGVIAFIRLDLTSAAERAADPQIAAAFEHAVQSLGVAPDRPMAYTRLFMSLAHHQAPTPEMAVCSQGCGPLMFTPGFALLYVRIHAWDQWQESARLCGAELVPELAHDAGSKHFHVTVQDQRQLSGVQWLARFSERTALADWGAPAAPPEVDASVQALHREEFGARVRDALRTLNDPLMLVNNPLVHCQAVRARVPARTSPQESVGALRALLGEEIEVLRGTERGDAWERVLQCTYVQSAGKHESVARDLGLSYSTFRRQLGAATDHIVDRLWRQELT